MRSERAVWTFHLLALPGCVLVLHGAIEWLAYSNNGLILISAVLMAVGASIVAVISIVAWIHFLILGFLVVGALLARHERTRLRYYARAAAWGHEISERVGFNGVLVKANGYIEIVPEGTIGVVVRHPGGPFVIQFPGREPYRFTLESLTWYVEIL